MELARAKDEYDGLEYAYNILVKSIHDSKKEHEMLQEMYDRLMNDYNELVHKYNESNYHREKQRAESVVAERIGLDLSARLDNYRAVVDWVMKEYDMVSHKYTGLVKDIERHNIAPVESGKCCVCLEKNTTIVLEPCHHCVLCPNCARNVITCPICRCIIKSRIEVYFFAAPD